jgi:hypothetical protein
MSLLKIAQIVAQPVFAKWIHNFNHEKVAKSFGLLQKLPKLNICPLGDSGHPEFYSR